jgi:hypothetical protein
VVDSVVASDITNNIANTASGCPVNIASQGSKCRRKAKYRQQLSIGAYANWLGRSGAEAYDCAKVLAICSRAGERRKEGCQMTKKGRNQSHNSGNGSEIAKPDSTALGPF